MQTNPFVYKFPVNKGGSISCISKSANYHMAIIVFDSHNAIVFTGSGAGTAMKTAGGGTSGTLPTPAFAKSATIVFFSHPVIAVNPPYTLDKSIKDPIVTPRPYGSVVNIISQNEFGTEECEVTFTVNS